MTLITRFSRLFRADLHAVLDRVEEPQVVLRQAVREMEEDLAAEQRRLGLLRDEQRRLAARDADILDSLQDLAAELETCFDAGKDDLARLLLRRRLEAERLRALLARRREESDEGLVRLAARVQEKAARLEAMRQKAALFAPEAAPAPADPWETPAAAVRDEDVEVAFLRERQRRAGR
jgi:phage shock protein A